MNFGLKCWTHENTLSTDGDDKDDSVNGENYVVLSNTGIEYTKLLSVPPHSYRNYKL
jgi:hypothetical protein